LPVFDQVVDVLVLLVLGDASRRFAHLRDFSDAFEWQSSVVSRFEHRVQQIHDDFMAGGRDAHSGATFHQFVNHVGTGKGFARTRRSLDGENGSIELGGDAYSEVNRVLRR
jgi:hypothetical protein